MKRIVSRFVFAVLASSSFFVTEALAQAAPISSYVVSVPSSMLVLKNVAFASANAQWAGIFQTGRDKNAAGELVNGSVVSVFSRQSSTESTLQLADAAVHPALDNQGHLYVVKLHGGNHLDHSLVRYPPMAFGSEDWQVDLGKAPSGTQSSFRIFPDSLGAYVLEIRYDDRGGGGGFTVATKVHRISSSGALLWQQDPGEIDGEVGKCRPSNFCATLLADETLLVATRHGLVRYNTHGALVGNFEFSQLNPGASELNLTLAAGVSPSGKRAFLLLCPNYPECIVQKSMRLVTVDLSTMSKVAMAPVEFRTLGRQSASFVGPSFAHIADDGSVLIVDIDPKNTSHTSFTNVLNRVRIFDFDGVLTSSFSSVDILHYKRLLAYSDHQETLRLDGQTLFGFDSTGAKSTWFDFSASGISGDLDLPVSSLLGDGSLLVFQGTGGGAKGEVSAVHWISLPH